MLERHRSKKWNLYIKWNRCTVVIYSDSIVRNLDWTFSQCKICVIPKHWMTCEEWVDCDPFAENPQAFIDEVNDCIDHPFGEDGEPDYVVPYNNILLSC